MAGRTLTVSAANGGNRIIQEHLTAGVVGKLTKADWSRSSEAMDRKFGVYLELTPEVHINRDGLPLLRLHHRIIERWLDFCSRLSIPLVLRFGVLIGQVVDKVVNEGRHGI